MNSILLTIIIVLLLIGVIAVAVVKGIARLMPWGGGMMQPPYYQSGYPQSYDRRSNSSGSGTGVLAVLLIAALIGTLYHAPIGDTLDGPARVMQASVGAATPSSSPQSTTKNSEANDSEEYEELANLGIFEPVREHYSPPAQSPPTSTTYTSGSQPVDDFYPRYAWQLGAYGSRTLADEYALEIIKQHPDVRVYDAGTGAQGRYKVVCSLSQTRQPVLDWRKKHAKVKGFITQIN